LEIIKEQETRENLEKPKAYFCKNLASEVQRNGLRKWKKYR